MGWRFVEDFQCLRCFHLLHMQWRTLMLLEEGKRHSSGTAVVFKAKILKEENYLGVDMNFEKLNHNSANSNERRMGSRNYITQIKLRGHDSN